MTSSRLRAEMPQYAGGYEPPPCGPAAARRRARGAAMRCLLPPARTRPDERLGLQTLARFLRSGAIRRGSWNLLRTTAPSSARDPDRDSRQFKRHGDQLGGWVLGDNRTASGVLTARQSPFQYPVECFQRDPERRTERP